MRVVTTAFFAGAAALALAAPTAGAQRTGTALSRQSSPVAAATDSGYSGKESDFSIGKRIYLRSTRTFIGTIIDVDEAHHFPPERFPRPEMKAVLVVRRDGPYEWVPVERATKIYVTR